jgi:hypothetical protein
LRGQAHPQALAVTRVFDPLQDRTNPLYTTVVYVVYLGLHPLEGLAVNSKAVDETAASRRPRADAEERDLVLVSGDGPVRN